MSRSFGCGNFALIVLLSITVAWGVDKDNGAFKPGRASSYPGNQTLDKITIAAIPYSTEAMASTAFGKVNPYKYGILSVLLVIENGTGKALRLNLQTQLITAKNQHLDPIPPLDVVLFNGEGKASWKIPAGTSPIPLPRGKKKGPLNTWEIEGRAFSAKLLPPGESVYGFYYFNALDVSENQLYVTGIKDAATGKDYFYFEVPVTK